MRDERKKTSVLLPAWLLDDMKEVCDIYGITQSSLTTSALIRTTGELMKSYKARKNNIEVR